MPRNANWSGRQITTTTNPQRLAPANPGRVGWALWNLSAVVGAKVGYSSDPNTAYMPVPPDATFALQGGAVVETNELWFHGDIGSEIGFGEA